MLTPQNNTLQQQTVLILFIEVVIISIYLISLSLVMARRAKRLMGLHNRKYYLAVVFYLGSKLILCAILVLRIIIGIPNQWTDLDANFIEIVIKNGIVLADLSIIELFLTALQSYFALYFSLVTDQPSKRQSKIINSVIRVVQLLVLLALGIPLVLYDLELELIGYGVLNGIGIALNGLILVGFLVSFLYLNFKMTGIMMEGNLNSTIRRLYKVLLIILISRLLMVAFEALVAVYVDQSFQATITRWSQGESFYLILAGLFLTSILLILLTEGLPVMYSLRGVVVDAMHYRPSAQVNHYHNRSHEALQQSIISDYSQDILESMLDKASDVPSEVSPITLAKFSQLQQVGQESEESIWRTRKGTLDGKRYLIRICKYEISSYILEDVQNELTLWNQLALRSQSRLSYFTQGQIVHLLEKYYDVGLDQRALRATTQNQQVRIALQVAQALEEFHEAGLVHGSLSPSCVFFEGEQAVLGGGGLLSMKKYLSLITGYSNKSIFTAIEHLKDQNSTVVKPMPQSDVYSFALILYELVTNNRQYRLLPLRQAVSKFADENFRPKLPDSIRVQVKNLIRKCWNEKAQKRPSMKEVIVCLKQLT